MSWTRTIWDGWKRGQRLAHTWANQVATAFNRAEVLDGQGRLYIGSDGGLKLHIDPNALAAQGGGAAEPFRITLEDATHYSVAAGRVRMRGATLATVAKVDGAALAATRWLYVPITISTGGSLTVGALAESATEPLYWGRDGSNQTVIQRVIGKIAVSAGLATLEYNTTGDIDLFDQAGQTVAPSAANNPVYLAAAFADTATYVAAADLLIKRGALEGTAPNQTLRLFLDDPAGAQLKIASGQLALDLTTVSGYNGAADQYLKHESGTLKWITVGTCS